MAVFYLILSRGPFIFFPVYFVLYRAKAYILFAPFCSAKQNFLKQYYVNMPHSAAKVNLVCTTYV